MRSITKLRLTRRLTDLQHVGASGILEAYRFSSNGGAMTKHLSYNHRGDVVMVTTNDGAVCLRQEYTAFGRPIQWNPIGVGWNRRPDFSTKEYDSGSGLSYYGFRYYDPEAGRWMKKDPMLWVDGANIGLFCVNNPVNLIDRNGNGYVVLGYGFGVFDWMETRDLLDGKIECAPISGFFQHCVNNCSVDRVAGGVIRAVGIGGLISRGVRKAFVFGTATVPGGDSPFDRSSWLVQDDGVGTGPYQANAAGLVLSEMPCRSCVGLCKAAALRRIEQVCCPYSGTDGKMLWYSKDDPRCCPPK